MSKADNMLSILWLLKSGKRMTAQQLADELEIHVRTVYRCIDSLCASGVPIIADSGHYGGYSILKHFSEAPLLFDMDEQKALIHASIFAQEAGYPFADALSRAIDKLKQYTNEEQLSSIERHSGGLAVIHPPADVSQQSVLQELELAAAECRTLEMEYNKGKEAPPQTRSIDPYGIVFWKGHWYVVGYCRLRQGLRSFRVDRIQTLVRTAGRFERPSEFSARDFLMSNLLPNALEADLLVPVKIWGHEQALNDLCQHWLFGHALVERTAEQALFKLGVESLLTYVPYFLLPYGRAITILEPDVLIEKMEAVTSGLAIYYQEMNKARRDPS
ncbi:helix-turn-helix transcriptional regulator [Paenibacillus eucommiae]|uniref:DNA-binding transcriptional regulator YafY n=1 Tax=Paenibacillus eucommiae TaxID=1355755 RepID=A0ABS4IW63_9BACL|nr:YafY family protein [Paenibacillus eucommiae]MBP1991836.1 putative DNA-binding transcriptional regulator YafY [Paenibacillus eucommiae]